MLKAVDNPNTKELCSMKVSGGSAKMLIEIDDYNDFEIFQKKFEGGEFGEQSEIMVIGEGTNTIFLNKHPNLILLKLRTKLPRPAATPSKEGELEVEAGVNWDELVQKYISLGGIGMEALSMIPGTVGASLVQNIGAYGEEVSNFVNGVYTYDLQDKKFKLLATDECNFSYRSSIFKESKVRAYGRYIILSVIFKIQKGEPKIPNYKDAEVYFAANPTLEVNVENIRQAIINIRAKKLPDPKIIANCGSFFKNPIVTQDQLKKVKEYFKDIPIYKIQNSELVKIPIAFTLERLGFKGYNPEFTKGNFGTYPNHALVVVSNTKGNSKEFLEFINSIKQKVFEVCEIKIEEEVNLV